ncbi:hypothetical protein ABZV91_31490, partial [Nocardia sp. NPDC004568]|uniref:hypothetical protein n=1 Tax=Nocardia sp. NPDC004568 TaxID=3154551 RepID=UPI0033B7FF29
MTSSRIGSRQLLEALLDPGSFVSWDSAPLDVARTGDYRSGGAAGRAAAGAPPEWGTPLSAWDGGAGAPK